MKCDGNPGGDCLSSCTTMHLSFTKDKSERNRVNMKINHHIADSFDTYYCNKISLSYSETVGVGNRSRHVTCSTSEEFSDKEVVKLLRWFSQQNDEICNHAILPERCP